MLIFESILISLLIIISIVDILEKNISNKNIIILFILCCFKLYFIDGFSDFGVRLLCLAFIIFIVIFLYALGAYGGGDAKLLIIAFMWIKPDEWIRFYTYLTISSLLVISAYYMYMRFIRRSQLSKKIAFGPCISISWALVLIIR